MTEYKTSCDQTELVHYRDLKWQWISICRLHCEPLKQSFKISSTRCCYCCFLLLTLAFSIWSTVETSTGRQSAHCKVMAGSREAVLSPQQTAECESDACTKHVDPASLHRLRQLPHTTAHLCSSIWRCDAHSYLQEVPSRDENALWKKLQDKDKGRVWYGPNDNIYTHEEHLCDSKFVPEAANQHWLNDTVHDSSIVQDEVVLTVSVRSKQNKCISGLTHEDMIVAVMLLCFPSVFLHLLLCIVNVRWLFQAWQHNRHREESATSLRVSTERVAPSCGKTRTVHKLKHGP